MHLFNHVYESFKSTVLEFFNLIKNTDHEHLYDAFKFIKKLNNFGFFDHQPIFYLECIDTILYRLIDKMPELVIEEGLAYLDSNNLSSKLIHFKQTLMCLADYLSVIQIMRNVLIMNKYRHLSSNIIHN